MNEAPLAGVNPGFIEEGSANRWVIHFPVHKNTTAKVFSIEAVEDAAKIALWESVPPGFAVDTERPQEVQWSEEFLSESLADQLVLVRVVAYLKEVQ